MWQWIVENWEAALGIVFGVIGVISLIVTIVIYFLQRQPKQLDWELQNDVQLVSPHARQLREKLELAYDGVPMKDPRVVIIRVRNTGKKAVSKDDFTNGEPIKIQYQRNWPLDVQLVQASRGLVRDRIAEIDLLYGNGFADPSEKDFGSCQVIPRLLNPREWFDVQLLSDKSHGDITVTGRFEDQARPMQELPGNYSNERQHARIKLALLASATLTVVMLGLLIGYALSGNSQP